MTLAQAAAAFDGIAEHYDAIFTKSLIGRAQRNAVWNVARRYFDVGGRILELNCGTGEDGLFLASLGMNVLAFDVSSAMIEVAERRKTKEAPDASIEFRVVAIENLNPLPHQDRFDGVFSNFSGLNCVNHLPSVACDLARLTQPGAKAILCLTNKYCVLEMLWYSFHGQFRRAFRRWSPDGVAARIGERSVHVRYPRVSEVATSFLPYFSLIAIHGIGIAVPPSYLEPWASRMPAVIAGCEWLDQFISRCPGLRSMGDHIVLVLERTTHDVRS